MQQNINPQQSLSPAFFLGGESVLSEFPQTALDWIEVVRNGLPASALKEILSKTRMTQATLSEALSIPMRTLARGKREGMLSPEVSAKIVRFARVLARAEEVIGDTDTAQNWMLTPNPSLDGQRPLFLLDTDIGAELILDTLGRIEHGVFA